MKKEFEIIVPSADLLAEMDAIEIHGGSDPSFHVYVLANCKPTNSGNCVSGCACTPPPPTGK